MIPVKQVAKKHNSGGILLWGGGIALFIFLIINIASSQTVSALYFRLINEDRGAIATYLTDIRKLPLFPSELIRYKNKYGVVIEKEVFKIEEERRRSITKLEAALKNNPSSRDLLYNLSILYHEAGDEKKAGEYLKMAKEIDPNVK